MTPETVLTIDELADYLKVSPGTVRLWMRKENPVPYMKAAGGITSTVRFVWGEVEQWLKEK